jgi:hypothetical protein
MLDTLNEWYCFVRDCEGVIVKIEFRDDNGRRPRRRLSYHWLTPWLSRVLWSRSGKKDKSKDYGALDRALANELVSCPGGAVIVAPSAAGLCSPSW